MLAKRYKLNGKTVNFLLRKRKVFHGRYYSIWHIPQYSGLHHHQRGFFVPKAIVKLAVKRHILTRGLYEHVQESRFVSGVVSGSRGRSSGTGSYYRFFVKPNKKNAETRKQLVVNRDKKRIVPTIKEWFTEDYGRFVRRC